MSNDQNRGGLQGKFEGFGANPTEGLWNSIDQNAGLQQKFDGYAAAPTVGLWDSIAANLDNGKDRIIGLWWWVSGAAAVVLLAFGLYQIQGQTIVKTDRTVAETAIKNDKGLGQNLEAVTIASEDTIDDSEQMDEVIPSENVIQHDPSEWEYIQLTDPGMNYQADKNEEPEIELREINRKPGEEFNRENVIRPMENSDVAKLNFTSIPSIYNDLFIDPLMPQTKIEKPQKYCKGWEIAANYSFWGPAFGGESYSEYTAPVGNVTAESTFETIEQTNGLLSSADVYEPAYGANPEAPFSGDAVKPFNLSLIAKRHFSCRWSAYSGISYSRQTYRSHYSSNLLNRTISSVNTIGIPMGGEFKFVNGNKWDWKLGLGNQVDLPILEKRKEIYSDLSDVGPVTSRNRARGILCSLESNLGVQRELTDRLNLNADIGVRWYYFQRTGETAPLIKKDVWLGGSIGLSWEI